MRYSGTHYRATGLSTDVSKSQSRFHSARSDEPEHPCTSRGNERALCLPANSPSLGERERETRFAQSIRSLRALTLAVEVHSQLRAAGAWLPAVRHHCPPRSCDGAPREPRRPESTPSGAAARWTAWGSTQTSVLRYRQQNNSYRVIAWGGGERMDAFAIYGKDVECRQREGKTQNETVEEQTSSANFTPV